jgi:hypothetical protein
MREGPTRGALCKGSKLSSRNRIKIHDVCTYYLLMILVMSLRGVCKSSKTGLTKIGSNFSLPLDDINDL